MSTEIVTTQHSAPLPVHWRNAKPSLAARPQKTDAQAELEIANRLEQARRQGVQGGLTAAQQQAEQELAPAIQKIAESLAELAGMREAIRERALDDLVQLALRMAARVMHREPAVDRDVLAGLLKASFARLRAVETSEARVHPALEALLGRGLEQSVRETSLRLIPDASVPFGQVVFQSRTLADSPAQDDLGEIDRGLTDKLGK